MDEDGINQVVKCKGYEERSEPNLGGGCCEESFRLKGSSTIELMNDIICVVAVVSSRTSSTDGAQRNGENKIVLEEPEGKYL